VFRRPPPRPSSVVSTTSSSCGLRVVARAGECGGGRPPRPAELHSGRRQCLLALVVVVGERLADSTQTLIAMEEALTVERGGSISAAVAAAAPGDTIRIAPGTCVHPPSCSQESAAGIVQQESSACLHVHSLRHSIVGGVPLILHQHVLGKLAPELNGKVCVRIRLCGHDLLQAMYHALHRVVHRHKLAHALWNERQHRLSEAEQSTPRSASCYAVNTRSYTLIADDPVHPPSSRSYQERLVLDKPIFLTSAPKGSSVVLEHVTSAPYEATLEILSDGVQVTGLTVRHASPSIANNYAVYVRGAAQVQLKACDVSSSTGSAVVRTCAPVSEGASRSGGSECKRVVEGGGRTSKSELPWYQTHQRDVRVVGLCDTTGD
jgi:hypothetical protein